MVVGYFILEPNFIMEAKVVCRSGLGLVPHCSSR
jgi:hypothetical protein